MKKLFVIYKITSPSGRVYIGKTSSFRKRMSYYRNHKNLSQKLLFSSFEKYGFENHVVEIIREKIEPSEANSMELFYIRGEQSNYLKYPERKGLNLTDGGEGTIGYKFSDELRSKLSAYHKANPSKGMLGKRLTEQQKQHLREINTGKRRKKVANASDEAKRNMSKEKLGKPLFSRRGMKASDETRLKQSLAGKGKQAWNKGIPMTNEHKELLRSINKGKPSARKGKKYELTNEQRKAKFGAQNIGNSYNKGRKHSPEYGKAVTERLLGKPNTKLYKPILQYSLDGRLIKEFPSIKSACEFLKLDASSVSQNLKGLIKKPRFFIFKYSNKVSL